MSSRALYPSKNNMKCDKAPSDIICKFALLLEWSIMGCVTFSMQIYANLKQNKNKSDAKVTCRICDQIS